MSVLRYHKSAEWPVVLHVSVKESEYPGEELLQVWQGLLLNLLHLLLASWGLLSSCCLLHSLGCLGHPRQSKLKYMGSGDFGWKPILEVQNINSLT